MFDNFESWSMSSPFRTVPFRFKLIKKNWNHSSGWLIRSRVFTCI